MRILGIIALVIIISLLGIVYGNKVEFRNHWNDAELPVGHPDMCIECHED